MGSSCPKLVRVYSERIERKEYPLPREPVPPKKQQRLSDATVAAELQKVALHYLIRQPGNAYCNRIKVNLNMLNMTFSTNIAFLQSCSKGAPHKHRSNKFAVCYPKFISIQHKVLLLNLPCTFMFECF